MKQYAHFPENRVEKDADTSFETLSCKEERDRSPWSDTQSHDRSRRRGYLTLKRKLQTFPWKICLAIAGLPLALALIVTLATAAEEASVGYILPRDCYPNGLWSEASGATWRIMDSSYFFTPNLSFGAMTFTQVKVIDIAWDLLVGRGGQLLLAYVNYRVFNEWLTYHMEMHLTSYKMYTAISFETTSLAALGVLGKEFLAFGEGTWKRFFRWLAVLSMLISTLYVLAFPTLMAAMTGYITTYAAYVEDYNGDLIEWEKVRVVWAIVHDSSRLGYTRPLAVTTEDREFSDALVAYIRKYADFPADWRGPQMWTSEPTDVRFSRNINTTFEFPTRNVELEAPSLNITWTSYTSTARNPTAVTAESLPGLYYSLTGDRQGDIYTKAHILEHGSCKPSETYQWGFSYIFLFMVSIFNFVWSCIMVGLWLGTKRRSRMYKAGRRPGLLKSVMALSRAIREEIGSDAEELEEQALRDRLRDSGGALVVPEFELKITRADSADLWKRVGKRRWPRASTF